jgi:HKD family nuclease
VALPAGGLAALWKPNSVSDVALRLQDPGSHSDYLLDVLFQAADGAERGGGIFAFATADGIRTMLLGDPFEDLLTSGRFDLVVGVDSITDTRALDVLTDLVARNERLSARVFVHDESVLFHSKLSWFRAGDQLTLIVGSGNLTVRGLRENWEAFTVVRVNGQAATEVEAQITAWLASQSGLLYPPTHPKARERAARNRGRERDLKHARGAPGKDVIPIDAQVLVAEAPKSGTRPSQVNFHKLFYEGFFGAQAGSGRVVILRYVAADGTVAGEEVRPSSNRESKNFSFELDGFKGLRDTHPQPVIGVYVRLPQGTILYQRLLPSDGGYAELQRFLIERWVGPAHMKRQVAVDASEVRAVIPKSSLWTAEIPSS